MRKKRKRKLEKPSKKEFFILRETKKGPALAWGAVETNQVLDTWMDEIQLLNSESKEPEMIVHPLIKGPRNHLFGVVAEIVINAHTRISR